MTGTLGENDCEISCRRRENRASSLARIDDDEEKNEEGSSGDTTDENYGLHSTGVVIDPIENTLADQNHGGDDVKERRLSRRISRRTVRSWKYEKYTLPSSTYTLIITEKIFSLPFLVGLIALGMSLTMLIIVMISELDDGSNRNPLGVPAGVEITCRIAQYLGVIIGVLMESEIPLALEILGQECEQLQLGRMPFNRVRVIVSCIMRLCVGTLFLFTLFLVVIQEGSALDIFFDMLALEFVENIDVIIYELCKRGFFGKELRIACLKTYQYDAPLIKHKIDKNNRTYKSGRILRLIIRTIYYVEMALMLGFLTFVVVNQNRGQYRCNSILVRFGDEAWEGAWVHHGEGVEPEDRLLIYSHFNGIYVETGTKERRPRYIEHNKEDGEKFRVTHPAEISYCDAIEAWVFRH